MTRSDAVYTIHRRRALYLLENSECPKDVFGNEIAPGDVVLVPTKRSIHICVLEDFSVKSQRAHFRDIESGKFMTESGSGLRLCHRVSTVDDSPWTVSDEILEEVANGRTI